MGTLGDLQPCSKRFHLVVIKLVQQVAEPSAEQTVARNDMSRHRAFRRIDLPENLAGATCQATAQDVDAECPPVVVDRLVPGADVEVPADDHFAVRF